MISPPDRTIALTLEAQADMFRLAERDYGLSLKAISSKANIPYDTIRSYTGGRDHQAQMPVSAVNKLVGVIPDALLSLLFNVAERSLVADEGDGGDETFADLAREGAGMASDYMDAAADGKITPIERARLKQRATRLTHKARRIG